MRRRRCPEAPASTPSGLRAALAVLVAVLALALLACATAGTAPSEKAPEPAEPLDATGAGTSPGTRARGHGAESSGLEIVSRPDEARVYLENRYVGLTPVFLADLPQGPYKLTLRKSGYYTASAWIDYAGGYLLYSTTLEMITGFLKMDVVPASAEVRVGSEVLAAGGLHELPVGTHSVRVRAFGYQEQTQTVRILEREVTPLEVTLQQARFSVSELRPDREAFNPRNAGLLGQVRVRFQVSSFGTGTVRILDPSDREVYAAPLPPFSTWEQSLRWDGRDPTGRPLPDGEYRLRVTAVAEDGVERLESDLRLRIDSSILLTYRSLWSGSAGMLYCPTPEVLAGGSLQLSSLALGGGSADTFNLPVDLSLRLGVGSARRYELDVLAGAIVGNASAPPLLPLFAAACFKASLLALTEGPLAASSAIQAKLAYQSSGRDSLANFSGLSIGLPAAVRLGPVTLAASPELVLSPWRVSYAGDDPPTDFYTWLYGRLGLLVEARRFSFGLSASFRSLPFQEGWGLDPPFQVGLEGHWLIPGTQLFLTLALAAELQAARSPELLGGGGLGILR